MGGIERKGKLFKVNNGGEREQQNRPEQALTTWGRRGPFIGPAEN
jgi:hypothetical protein